MTTATPIESFNPPDGGVALTIGNFDGVHLGHQRILETAKRSGLPVVAMTFDPPPREVLVPDRAPARLTTTEEKAALLGLHGADHVIVLPCDRALLARTPDEFLESFVARCKPRLMVEGPSFRFGSERSGTIESLQERAGKHGYRLEIVDDVACTDLSGAPQVSSSAIRAALAAARVDVVNAMLGRPYRIAGTVGRGSGRGGPLGFPTANLMAVPHLLPREAVYAGVAELDDGALRLAAINIGRQPTFGDATPPRIEAHLLDFGGNLRGRALGLHLLACLRKQVKFTSTTDLTAQLRQDVDATRILAARVPELRTTSRPPLPRPRGAQHP